LRGQYGIETTMSSEPEMTQEQREAMAAQMYMFFRDDPTVDQVQLRRWIAGVFNDVSFSSIFKRGILGGGASGGQGGMGGDQAGPPTPDGQEIEETDATEPLQLPGPGGAGVP